MMGGLKIAEGAGPAKNRQYIEYFFSVEKQEKEEGV
jgi:hypothetical protein